MKTKVQLLLATLVASALSAPCMYAQTDITSQHLVNPDFEFASEGVPNNGELFRGDPWGWQRTGDLLGNSWGTNADGINYNGSSLCWYNSSPMPEKFELYQIVEGLPAGDYLVTCRLGIFADRVGYQRLFANNNVQYYGKESVYTSNLIEGEINTFAGWDPTPSGLALLQDMLVMVTIKEGEPLKLGIRSNNLMSNGTANTTTNYGWFKVDYFNLYYLEEGISGYHKMNLSQKIEQINQLDPDQLPRGTWNSINAIKAIADEIYNSSDNADELSAMVTKLDSCILEADTAQRAVQDLNDFVDLNYPGLKALKYPGLETFEAEYWKTVDLQSDEEATRKDFEQALIDFKAAIDIYKISGFEIASLTNPIDASFLIKNPDFEQGDKNWDLDGFWTIGTGDQYPNFGGTFMERWIDIKLGTLGDFGASQTLTGLRNGIYRISSTGSACNQGDATLQVTGAYLYGNSTYQSVMSENGVGARFEFDVIVTDGTLTIGMKTVNTNANWAAFDNLGLSYLGNGDLNSYKTAYTQQITRAKEMLKEDILPGEMNSLRNTINNVEQADQTSIASLEKVLSQLNTSLNSAEVSMKGLKNFKAGSYNNGIKITVNEEGIYDEPIIELMANVMLNVDDILAKDTTTAAAYPELTTTLDKYLSFTGAYQKFTTLKETTSESNLLELIEAVTDSQLEAVTADSSKISHSKEIFATISSFINTYTLAIGYAFDEEYSEEACLKLMKTIEEQFAITKENYDKASEAEKIILSELGAMRFNGIDAGENSEVTKYTIVNPETDNTVSSEAPQGWTVDRGNGNDFSNCGAHWSGDVNDYYLNSYNSAGGQLKYTAQQEIKGIPNGTYKLVAAARAHGNNSYVYAKANGMIYKTEIPNMGDRGGNIWESLKDDPIASGVHDGAGYGWNWVEVADINVNTNSMTIGCSTNSAVTQGNGFNGYWISVDNFKLYYTNADYSGTGIEEVNSENSGIIAYSQNGYIQVIGEENYTITSINGIPVSPNTQLAPGIYIVKTGNKIIKVTVE